MGHLWVTTKSPAARFAAGAGVLGVLVIGLVPVLLGRPAPLLGTSTLPWWAFAIAFAVTEACGLNVNVRGRRYPISLSGIPLITGLYLSDPGPLLIARLLGSVAVAAWYRRHNPVTLLTGAFAVIAGTGVAELLFRTLVLPYGVLSYPGRLMTLAVVVVAALVEICLLLRVHLDAAGRRAEALRLLVRAVAAGVMGAAIGLIPVISISRGEPLLTAAVIGPGLVLGLHAFAMLSERHARLHRLYELSEALAHQPAPARAIPLVLEQSADLLRARYSELVLNDDLGRSTSGRRLWSHRSGHVIGPRTPADDLFPLPFPPIGPSGAGMLVRGRDRAERDFLRARGLGQAVLVPLRIDDDVAGHLLVGERSGGERGFAASDLATLQTVAGRAAVALSNGHLMERLRFEARHDELTGLPNRLDFRAQLDGWVPELVSGSRSCAVMLLDLNGFKAINDTLGHQAGDQLLRELAGRLGRVAGRGTTVARLGGDEFAVLAPGLGDDAARALARRLLTVFDEPVTLEGQELRVSGSLGVAVGPDQGTTGAELLRRADVAMYVAKSAKSAKSAGGGYRMFTRSMDLPASQLQTLATALEEALLQDRIGIAVLPVVDLVTGRVHALEALARWNHPELGEVPPEDFFAAAERSGLVTELSRRVLDQALAAAREWLENGQQVRVAVNLAPGWLADPTLPEQITTALAVHDLPPDLLYLEVTEGDVIDEQDHALASLTRLRALGVRLSVDDFGTGYSSLTFLSRLPVSQVKIHQSLVQELRAGGTGRAVVQSIIDLGRNLGLEVVAEGVTDAHTRIELKRMGCGFGQGYYFNAPVAVGDLTWAAGHRLRTPVTLPPAPRVVGALDTLDECSPQTAPPSAP
ncbi:EAL domain-containing protein [Kineosporia sp. NBRC 101731]|uniref:putative bifunctional diguanylate cyclase/phosphodiesterase n=1 Tax=Kineosporia sp. NBRC 101731 TaxID=3032199 RepID=UPI0024A321E3|nr:EAL domain-containing protein [Kineosporia sp. NBRC 101731]GLY27108.1 hypothetical protein Kisp02_04730 [Kineosporia sp. NBRC 101731]